MTDIYCHESEYSCNINLHKDSILTCCHCNNQYCCLCNWKVCPHCGYMVGTRGKFICEVKQ